MTIWVTSDWHFGHANILRYTERRRYLGLDPALNTDPPIWIPEDKVPVNPDEIVAMNEALVALWNSTVDPDDEVIILGDLAMGQIATSLTYVARLNGHKSLIPGNHDRMHPIMSDTPAKVERWTAAYEEAGVVVFHHGPVTWSIGRPDGSLLEYDVSHFPYTIDHTENPRYQQYRPTDNGRPLLHGHVHDLYKHNGREFNVGLDAWERLLTLDEVSEYFQQLA